jgi:predicted nucleic acid-binding protein
MILIADCSALVALASCDGLGLLNKLFGTVIVPEAVYHEAVVNAKPEAQQLKDYLHNKIRKIDLNKSILLDGFSDLGETEAMLLYKQYSAINC